MSIKPGFVPITAASIQDALGNLLAEGSLSVLPTDANDIPINVPAGGSGGIITSATTAVLPIANGGIPVGSQIADTSATGVPDICYRITIYDSAGSRITVYTKVQTKGQPLNLDTYVPNLAPQLPVQPGPQGLSAYQVYQSDGGTLDEADWLASLHGATGAPGIASLPQLAAIRATQPITNLLDPSLIQSGYYYNSDGSLSGGGTYPNGVVTGKMAANSGGFMICNAPLVYGAGGEVIFYDQSGAYVSNFANSTGAAIPANTPIAIPANAAFVAWTLNSATPATCQIVNGSTMPAWMPFAPASTVAIDAAIAATNAAVAAVGARIDRNYSSIRALNDFSTAKNLIGPQIMTYGGYLVGNGTIATGQPSSYQYTAKIPVIAGEPYIIGFPNIPAIPVQPTAVIAEYGGAIYTIHDINDNVIMVGNVTGAVYPGPGVDVLPSTGLPNGYIITMPADAAYIRFSGSNLTASQGCQWSVNGNTNFWTPDANANNTQFCSCIFMHGTTLPNHLLPYGKSANDYVPYLLGRKIGIWGDSIASNFGVGWEQLLWERGFTKQVQDARPGRSFVQAFEGFQTVTPGSALGTYDAGVAVSAQSGCAQGGYLQSGQTTGGLNWGGEALGQTLAQVLAPVELLVLALGTNDQAYPLGAFGDATNANTQYGNMRWVGETLHEANPNMTVLWVTCMPKYDGAGFAATSTLPLSLATAAATVDIASNYFHDPVIDMTKVSGVNALTASARTQDGIHPALGAAGMTGYYGATILGAVTAHL
jgi:hypothetical protein